MHHSICLMLRAARSVCLCSVVLGLVGCINLGSLAPGKMESVQPESQGPHAGRVYLVRGWVGVFSQGMDQIGRKLNDGGGNALVFQHDQCRELARVMAERYKATKYPAPICLVGHSYGSD